jgi:dUTP pyrophosphatase
MLVMPALDLFAPIHVAAAIERLAHRHRVAIAQPEGSPGSCSRSAVGAESGLSFVNTPGLIDSHYRGEIK